MKLTYFKNLIRYGALIILCACLSKNVLAQKPELLTDLNQVPQGVNPRNMVDIDGTLYLSAQTNNRGYQMFTYDGTTAEGFFFRDGYGDQNWAAAEFTQVGNNIYFRSGDEEVGAELRKYDGENFTTVDIYPGSDSSQPWYLIEYNGKLYFSAIDETAGRELWEYDGENLTLFDINEGAAASSPEGFVVYNNELVFVANGGNGQEIWTYDGESLTNFEINDSGEGIVNGFENELTEYNGVLHFVGNDGSGRELWAFDGTEVYNVNTELGLETELYQPRYLTVYDGKLYFEGYIGASVIDELCYFDGTTVAVADESASANNIRAIEATTTHLFFRGEDESGEELFVFDGTDIVEFDHNTGSGDSYPWNFTPLNNRMYYIAETDTDGIELWMHDGTTATLIDIYEGSQSSNPKYLTVMGNSVFCNAQAVVEGSTMTTLWEYDGTDLNYVNVSGQTLPSYPSYLTEFLGDIYFVAEDTDHGTELFVYDGNTTAVFEDIYDGESSSSPEGLTQIGDELFFFAENDEVGEQLYVYDGTTYSTYDLIGGDDPFVEYNGNVYFAADDGENGTELWVYNGATTEMVEDINDGGSSIPNELYVHAGLLFFSANDGVNGYELWIYDGETAAIVDDINTEGNSSPSGLISFDGDLYFSAESDVYGRELCIYDGESVSIADINTGAEDSSPSRFAVYGQDLVFQARDADDGIEFHYYRAGSSGVSFFDINVGSGWSYPQYFTEFNGILYFAANDGINGRELWQYDGTSVSMVQDFYSGTDGLNVNALTLYGSVLYITSSAKDNYELYRMINDEIEFVDDVYIEENNGGYGRPVKTEEYMYFGAASIAYGGEELWRIRKTSEETDILTFNIADQSGESTINTTSHTVTVEMPFGTDLSALSPSFTISDYAEVSIGSGVSQDFSNGAVAYTVTAEFGNTQEWQVNVVEGAASIETDIVTFDLTEQTGAATINATDHTVTVEVAYDTDISSLTPTITLSDGASISPQGAQDFSEVFSYTVTAEDSETSQVWTVMVTEAASNETDILTFELAAQTGVATVDATNHTILAEVVFDTDLTNLTPAVTVSEGAALSPEGAQDFTSVFTYTVTAEDGVTAQNWEVTIIVEEEEPEEEEEEEEEEEVLAVEPSASTLNVYPNPTIDWIAIGGQEGALIQIKLVKLEGSIALNQWVYPDEKVDVSHLRTGLYLLQATQDKLTTTTKILIH